MFNQQILCPHFNHCSGCVIDTNVDHLPLFIDVQCYFSSKNFAIPDLVVGPATGWRCRAKLAVRQPAPNGEVLIGLFREGTHHVQAIPHCRVHHPSINKATALIKRWIATENVTVYDESTGCGDLRYLVIAVDRATERVQLTVVINAHWPSVSERWTRLLEALWTRDPLLWHSLWYNDNVTRANVITGHDWRLVKGEPWLWDRIDQVEIAFHSSAFAQANLTLFERIVSDLCSAVDPRCTVAEYYAGVGVIGLNLAVRGCCVQLNERSPGAEVCFNKSLERLSDDVSRHVSFHTGGVDAHLSLMDSSDVVVVDPPRKGLDKTLLQKLLAASSAQELFYLSCGWPAFQRDCDALVAAGWLIKTARAYLLFPGTNQLEILAHFVR